jgi:CubicO group peptidase (beta-lactamase class C family)
LIISFIACKTKTQTDIKNLEQLKINKIDSLANRYLELNRFSGVILLPKNNIILYNKNFGLADYENKTPFSKETSLKIGEISELVIANIIHKMVLKDKLQLSDKIYKYIPEIKFDLTVNDVLIYKRFFRKIGSERIRL